MIKISKLLHLLYMVDLLVFIYNDMIYRDLLTLYLPKGYIFGKIAKLCRSL